MSWHSLLNRFLRPLGLQVVGQKRLARLQRFHDEFAATPGNSAHAHPHPAIRDYLRQHDARLESLRMGYQRFQDQDHTVWSPRKVGRGIDLTRFRGDNKYLYQGRGTAWFQYLETARYVAGQDELNLTERLTEDGAFGCYTVETDEGRRVSRDWLDSILEINFLERVLGLSRERELKVLDIGAGYGRFGHRLVEALPQASVWCADAVPESTFLQEFYVRFRSIEDRVRVLTLPEAAELGPESGFHLAVNIHSFHECPISWIDWWLDLLQRCRIRYFFLVVDLGQGMLSREADGSHVDFLPNIQAHGYRLHAEQEKYAGSSRAEKLGLFPARYSLFELDVP